MYDKIGGNFDGIEYVSYFSITDIWEYIHHKSRLSDKLLPIMKKMIT